MAFDYINEAFKRLSTLEEEMFSSSPEGINKLSEFVTEDDNTQEVVRVIDPETTDAETLEDSYVGKVIVNCNVCHSHIFENKEDITIDEEGIVNVDVQCPYCGESEGFLIVGEIAPFSNTEDVEDTVTVEGDVDSTEDDVESTEDDIDETNESCSRATKRAMREDFKEVSIKTEDQMLEMTSDENGKVTVTTEPIEAESTEETIVPVSDETTEEILSNNEVEDEFNFEEEDFTEETTEEDDSEDAPIFEESLQSEKDIDFDDIDEDSLNTVSEKYLKHVYENVESFKTTDVSCTPSQMIVEGIIRFNSGAEKKTGFIFEAKDVNSRGQVRFTGSNKHLTESANAFTLVASVDNNKLFTESLKYQYSVNDQPVRGVARRK